MNIVNALSFTCLLVNLFAILSRRAGNQPGARHGEDAGSMKLLRRLYAKRGFRDPAGAMLADGLLLAAVVVAALAVLTTL